MTGDAADIRLARLADAGSLLGQLQRGRGEGYLAALDLPSADAADLVWECIVHDPRWDLQVESRDEYYASLARHVDLDVERLKPQNCPTPVSDVDQRLVVGVLGELAAAGVLVAGDALLAYVAEGEQWDDAIYQISQAPGDLYLRLPGVLESRFSENECESIVRRWRQEVPWEEIADDQSWVGRAIETLDEERSVKEDQRSEPPAMNRPARELLAYPWRGAMPRRLMHRLSVMLRDGERSELVAALENPAGQRWIAFQTLARLDDPGGMSVAEQILRADTPGRDWGEALRYLQNLSGEHTLGLARSWVDESDGRGQAARSIFERHAEGSDLALLVSGLAQAWDERDFYALCSLIDALARLSGSASVDQLATIYEEVEYSYARRRAARALIAIDEQAFLDRYARSALWDCEREIQDLAVGLLGDHVDEVAARQTEVIEVQRIR